LEKQRHLHGDKPMSARRLLYALLHELFDRRVNDGIEIAQRMLVAENNCAELLAIDRAAWDINYFAAEPIDDRLVCGVGPGEQLMCEDVRINYCNAQSLKLFADERFAAGDTAGDTQYQSFRP